MTNRENGTVRKDSIYEEFILWTSMPPTERYKLGIETQEQFADFYKISINTPTAWKRRADFQPRVTALRKEWAFEKTSMVLESVLRNAVKGSSASQKLWLQYFHNFPKEQEQETKKISLLHHNDIRMAIDVMPPDLKAKYYGFLQELVDTLDKLAETGELNVEIFNPDRDHTTSLSEEDERNSIREARVAAEEESKRFDNLPLEQRGMANIIRRGI